MAARWTRLGRAAVLSGMVVLGGRAMGQGAAESAADESRRAAGDLPPSDQPFATPVRHEFIRLLMGVEVRILIWSEDAVAATRGAAVAFARIAAIEDVASDWRASSEVMRLCREPAGAEVAVSGDLLAMLDCAERVSMASGGAFDATIGAVTHLWREAGRQGRTPSEAEIARARSLVGFRHVVIDLVRGTVRLRREGVVIDLGGIAQGYAAREALAVLASHGLAAACVDVSGDIAVGEPPAGREGWRIAVPSPEGARVLVLSHAAVSTSGDGEQAVEVLGDDGEVVRESHILDPQRGRGVVGMNAVTVVGPDAMLCDALATAVSVMGAERGRDLIARIPGYDVIVVGVDGGVTRSDGEREGG
ncbi:MAG: FAD:protein FMN transferase [Phycisphaerales bacterium]